MFSASSFHLSFFPLTLTSFTVPQNPQHDAATAKFHGLDCVFAELTEDWPCPVGGETTPAVWTPTQLQPAQQNQDAANEK